MISGRGLGFTGGTLDKLDAIPGYQSQVSLERFRKTVQQCGCAIVGANKELAPADAALYSVRDLTATVDCEALIVSSILAKKLAAGLDALILDVKTGSGATVPELDRARSLAQSLVATATASGLKTTALITNMDQPLAHCAGNALEMRDAISFLCNANTNARQHELVMALGARLLCMADATTTHDEAHSLLTQVLNNGSAAECAAKMIHGLGGPADFLSKAQHYLSVSGHTLAVESTRPGFVTQIDTRRLGMVVVSLGAGRVNPSSSIDTSTGLSDIAAIGDSVDSHRPLAIIHAQSESQCAAAANEVRAAFTITTGEPSVSPQPVVIDAISTSEKQ